jgi:enamine deaminase RidA (YjgF/YER057c/UK114 family)
MGVRNEDEQGRPPRWTRRGASSGSPLEPKIGFARAVRVGPIVSVSGTAPIGPDGRAAHVGDVYAQSRLCIEIIRRALADCGCRLEDVTRTRILLTDIRTWEAAAWAHGEAFGSIRPACTVVEVSRFVDPAWLVEFEADAVAPE